MRKLLPIFLVILFAACSKGELETIETITYQVECPESENLFDYKVSLWTSFESQKNFSWMGNEYYTFEPDITLNTARIILKADYTATYTVSILVNGRQKAVRMEHIVVDDDPVEVTLEYELSQF